MHLVTVGIVCKGIDHMRIHHSLDLRTTDCTHPQVFQILVPFSDAKEWLKPGRDVIFVSTIILLALSN
jgi:hypothetical protein